MNAQLIEVEAIRGFSVQGQRIEAGGKVHLEPVVAWQVVDSSRARFLSTVDRDIAAAAVQAESGRICRDAARSARPSHFNILR